jgi:hypothetical protein|nr:MAG TPA: hypothetical protein [Caudoviricetes sp.]
MNSSILFLNIHQVLSYSPDSRNYPTDYDRKLVINLSRNESGTMSFLALEFKGVRSKFTAFVKFDGSGDYGVNTRSLIMPNQYRLSPIQRSMILFSILEWANESGIINISLPEFIEQTEVANSGGVGSLSEYYRILCENSRTFVQAKDAGQKLTTYQPFWKRIPKVVYDHDSPALAAS